MSHGAMAHGQASRWPALVQWRREFILFALRISKSDIPNLRDFHAACASLSRDVAGCTMNTETQREREGGREISLFTRVLHILQMPWQQHRHIYSYALMHATSLHVVCPVSWIIKCPFWFQHQQSVEWSGDPIQGLSWRPGTWNLCMHGCQWIIILFGTRSIQGSPFGTRRGRLWQNPRRDKSPCPEDIKWSLLDRLLQLFWRSWNNDFILCNTDKHRCSYTRAYTYLYKYTQLEL